MDHTGRLFVVEQPGRIEVLSKDGSMRKLFLDIGSEVRTETTEEGLLGLAFDPKFKDNGFFYVIYSKANAKPRRTVLARFRVSRNDPNLADPKSEKLIFQVEKPYPNHNGGCLLFGPDHDLYFSLGDGGSGGDPHNNAQDLRSWLGKILRIDPSRPGGSKPYSIPKDNPFLKDPQAKPEIYAYGLRNPWRMSFDRLRGELWAGDVGQDKWEEVDLIKKGGDYGWSIKEGTHPFKGIYHGNALIDPVLDYGRQDGFCVTGGYVYRGKAHPELDGFYIFGDFGSKKIWSLPAKDPQASQRQELLTSPEAITSFGEDEDAELYVLGYQGLIYTLK
jgi:glucose/arabinose dehydrogenase